MVWSRAPVGTLGRPRTSNEACAGSGNHVEGQVQMNITSRFLGAMAVATAALLSAPINSPVATAAPCPDVEVLFARGTFEPAGVGGTGQAFVDSLSSKVGAKSIEVYPVNYPASLDFATAA